MEFDDPLRYPPPHPPLSAKPDSVRNRNAARAALTKLLDRQNVRRSVERYGGGAKGESKCLSLVNLAKTFLHMKNGSLLIPSQFEGFWNREALPKLSMRNSCAKLWRRCKWGRGMDDRTRPPRKGDLIQGWPPGALLTIVSDEGETVTVEWEADGRIVICSGVPKSEIERASVN